MRYSRQTLAGALLLAFSSPATADPPPGAASSAAASKSKNSPFGPAAADNDGGVIEEGPVECVLHLVEPYMIDPSATDDGDDASSVACVMSPSYEGDGISGTTYAIDVDSFPSGFFDDVDFAATTLSLSAAKIRRATGPGGGGGGPGPGKGRNAHGGGTIAMAPGSAASKGKGSADNAGGNGGKGGLRGGEVGGGSTGKETRRRRLAQTMGASTLVVLYAVPPDARNSIAPSRLADDIFGVSGDPVNARTQSMRCSGGKLEYVPACGSVDSSCHGEPTIVDGVMEVPIEYNVTDVASGTVKNWVEAAAQVMLSAKGIDLFSFTQIMHVIPDAASWGGAAAWAYLPGQTSAFRDSYSWRMGVQIHEFGHNMGMGHSGYNGAGYADHSCLMGSPSYGDDGPEICWNAAKSWQSGWYADDSEAVVPSGYGGPYSAELVGVSDWADGLHVPGTHRVVLRVEDSTESPLAYHVIYNRAEGPNAGVTFAKDQVTVSLGGARATSWHQAGLGRPDPASNFFPTFRKAGFDGLEKDLVIKVCSMTPLPTCTGGDTCGCDDVLQADYRGTLDTTAGGFACQRWDSQSPHSHSRSPGNYPNAGLEENYCRNPDGEPRAWCYTADPSKRWDYCNVPSCTPPASLDTASVLIYLDDGVEYNNGEMCPGEIWVYNKTLSPTVSPKPTDQPSPAPTPCVGGETCGCDGVRQADYRGTIATTTGGIACQSWDAQSPLLKYLGVPT